MTIDDLPEGWEPVENLRPGVAKITVPEQPRGAAHFNVWRTLIDMALDSMEGQTDEEKQLSLSATIHYRQKADGEDPGWVVGYGAEFS